MAVACIEVRGAGGVDDFGIDGATGDRQEPLAVGGESGEVNGLEDAFRTIKELKRESCRVVVADIPDSELGARGEGEMDEGL